MKKQMEIIKEEEKRRKWKEIKIQEEIKKNMRN